MTSEYETTLATLRETFPTASHQLSQAAAKALTSPTIEMPAPTPKTAHTPGPWHVSGGNQIGNPNRPYDIVAGFSLLAQVGVLTGTQHAIGESQANARLIAAAPQLLAALKRILAAWDSGLMNYVGREPGQALQAVRDAIAKAEAS